jgi:hypothetical protein
MQEYHYYWKNQFGMEIRFIPRDYDEAVKLYCAHIECTRSQNGKSAVGLFGHPNIEIEFTYDSSTKKITAIANGQFDVYTKYNGHENKPNFKLCKEQKK